MSTARLLFAANCGRLEPAHLSAILDLIDLNPFGRVNTLAGMSDNLRGETEDFEPERLLHIADSKSAWNVALCYRSGRESVDVDLARRAEGATVAVSVSSVRLRTDYDLFLRYAQGWITALPDVANGRIYDTGLDIVGLYRELDIEHPPACFTTHLRWVHFLGPEYYCLYLKPDDLLATPVLATEVLANDVVQIQLVDNPFEFNSAPGKRALIEATRHLNDSARSLAGPRSPEAQRPVV